MVMALVPQQKHLNSIWMNNYHVHVTKLQIIVFTRFVWLSFDSEILLGI